MERSLLISSILLHELLSLNFCFAKHLFQLHRESTFEYLKAGYTAWYIWTQSISPMHAHKAENGFLFREISQLLFTWVNDGIRNMIEQHACTQSLTLCLSPAIIQPLTNIILINPEKKPCDLVDRIYKLIVDQPASSKLKPSVGLKEKASSPPSRATFSRSCKFCI